MVTLGEGLVYESLNFAALQQLPILFLVENNGYAQTTPARIAVSGSMTDRARAFGIDAEETDSSDVLELYNLFKNRTKQIRESCKPFYLVVNTYRLAAHSKGDDIRPEEEVAQQWKCDPLLLNGEKLDAEERQNILAGAKDRIAEAIEVAENAPMASPEMLPSQGAKASFKDSIPVAQSKKTFLKALNDGLKHLLETDDRVFMMGEDILDPYGGAFGAAKGLSTAFPDRVIPSPISEAGLAAWGGWRCACRLETYCGNHVWGFSDACSRSDSESCRKVSLDKQ